MIVTKAEELVGSAHPGERGTRLITDCLRTEELRLSPVELHLGEAIGREFIDLVIKLMRGQVDLLRIGSKVKDEGSWGKARGVRGPDKVGEA